MHFFKTQRKFKDDQDEIEYIVKIIMNLPEEKDRSKTTSSPEKNTRPREKSCKDPLEQSLYLINYETLDEGLGKKQEILEETHDFSVISKENENHEGEEWSVYKDENEKNKEIISRNEKEEVKIQDELNDQKMKDKESGFGKKKYLKSLNF